MSRTLPTAYVQPSQANMARGEIILSGDMADVAAMANYHYAHAGGRLRGVIFEPPFQTTSATYTVVPDTATDRNLDTAACVTLPLKLDALSNHVYTLKFYGANVDVQVTVKRLDTGATVTTSSASTAGTPEWRDQSFNVSLSGVALEFTLEALWTSDGTEAKLWQLEIHESVYTAASSLPTS